MIGCLLIESQSLKMGKRQATGKCAELGLGYIYSRSLTSISDTRAYERCESLREGAANEHMLCGFKFSALELDTTRIASWTLLYSPCVS